MILNKILRQTSLPAMLDRSLVNLWLAATMVEKGEKKYSCLLVLSLGNLTYQPALDWQALSSDERQCFLLCLCYMSS